MTDLKEERSFQSLKSIIIPVLLIITIAAAYIDRLDPQPKWWQSMQSWLKYSLAKPESDTSSQMASPASSSTTSRTFLGRSQTGYELWADKSCVYVKGSTEADLARLHTNVQGFKDAIKAQTGNKCVLFE
jgi:hypothetical protein